MFPSGDAVISLGIVQRLTVVSYYSLLSVLYSEEHSARFIIDPSLCDQARGRPVPL
jgi:hypothetical protein